MTDHDNDMAHFLNHLEGLEGDALRRLFDDLILKTDAKWAEMGPKLRRLVADGRIDEAETFVDDEDFKGLDEKVDLTMQAIQAKISA